MGGEALILATDETRRDGWKEMVADRGLTPIATGAAAKAQWLIEDHHFCLALLEWIPSAGRPAVGTVELLATLRRAHREIVAVVSVPASDDIEVERAIYAAHPTALTHDPRLGDVSLAARLDGLLGRQIGDLVVHGGSLVHAPSGDRFQHPIAAQLLLAYPGTIAVDYTSTCAMRITRLRRWLAKHGSSVDVINVRGLGMYRMVVVDRSALRVRDLATRGSSAAA